MRRSRRTHLLEGALLAGLICLSPIVPTLSTKLKLPGRQQPPTFVPKGKGGSR